MRKAIKIKDLGEVITGNTPPRSNPELYGRHTPFIKATDIEESSKFTYFPEEFYSEIGFQKYKKSLIRKGASCVVTIGSVGKKMTMAHCDCFINQAMNAVVPNNNYDDEYVYYLLKNNIHKLKMLNSGTASGRENISKSAFSNMEIEAILDKDKQIIIGKILSAYDKLIENNQKQIKLLEEAAQRLYKEWFVDLRFPGCENTPIIDGVPEGWKKGILGDIAINVGKKVKKEDRNKYKQYLPIDCLPRKSLAYTESLNIKLAESSLVSFKPKDILFGAMRPYFHKVVIVYDKGLTRNTCFVINAKEREFLSYLTMLLFSDNTINYATTISVGTTMPYVRLNDFLNMEIIIPAPHIVKEFEKLFKPISEDIVNFAKQIGVLSEARDRLLTKLMSGEIEV